MPRFVWKLRHDRYPGVFALVNGLSWSGQLTAAQERFRRRENAWYHADLIGYDDQVIAEPAYR